MTTETNTVFDTVKEAFAPVTDALKNLQTMEVPEAARDFVKRSANTAKERAADVFAGSEKVTAVIETAVADSVSEAAKISRNIQQALYQDAEAFFAGIDRLASAKSLNDRDKAVMTATSTFSFDTPGDAQRAAELKRVKAQATVVLAGTLTLFVVAKVLLHVHPAFGFIAAFAEAATIGGLADWYAVVALFRRPLGLPIPHTAIIQNNQHRIADRLGEVLDVPFLQTAPGDPQFRPIPFASFLP